MLNKEHITRGDAKAYSFGEQYTDTLYSVGVYIASEHEIAMVLGRDEDKARANAAFIADAFNGFNRTGKTYGELVEEIEGLKKQLLNK